MALYYGTQTITMPIGASATSGFTVGGYENFSLEVPTHAAGLGTAAASVKLSVFNSDKTSWVPIVDSTSLKADLWGANAGNFCVTLGTIAAETIRIEVDGTNSTATAAVSFKVRGMYHM
jgi:hypothetical protein